MSSPTGKPKCAAPKPIKRARLWTAVEVARFLGCTTRHVFNLRKRGLPAYRIGDMVRFDIDRVRQWLDSAGTDSSENAGSRQHT